MAMLTVEQAQERILADLAPLAPVRLPIVKALGLVLAEEVHAGEDIPPYANSSMDGYAVRAADTAGAGPQQGVRLRVLGEVAAGYVSRQEVRPGTALRIMTGAPIPLGADAVVQVEATRPAGEEVEVLAPVRPGTFVRPAGEDVRQGELVLPRGTALRPQEVGMLATLGHKTALVHRRPRVAILATGDEVAAIDAPLAPGQIRNANSYSNAAQVVRMGAVPVLLGIARDTVADLTARIRDGLSQGVDLFLSSGGVSVGHFDLVRDVLAAQGQIDFWRVRLEGLAFLAAATLLGGAMAIGPLAAAIGLLVAVWFGVRSVYSPRSRATPLLDRVIVGAGLLVWFAPALAAIAQAVLALTSGRIHFVRPPRDYFLATDPIAFWQGVGFWLIIAALAGFLAWRYWQPKLFPAETATREA